jgi:hypothetical protein
MGEQSPPKRRRWDGPSRPHVQESVVLEVSAGGAHAVSADASGDLVHGKQGPETTVPEAALRDRPEIAAAVTA